MSKFSKSIATLLNDEEFYKSYHHVISNGHYYDSEVYSLTLDIIINAEYERNKTILQKFEPFISQAITNLSH